MALSAAQLTELWLLMLLLVAVQELFSPSSQYSLF